MMPVLKYYDPTDSTWKALTSPASPEEGGSGVTVQSSPPADPADGDLWLDTDETNVGDSSTGLVQIESKTLTAAAANVTFSTIPQTYRSLRLVMQARTDRAAANDDEIGLRFNGDSSAIYDSQYMQSYAASTVAGGQILNASSILVGMASAALSPATYAASGEVVIPDYAGTVLAKNIMSDGHSRSGSGNAMYRLVGGGTWRNAAAITSITLISRNAANFIAGSTFTLYGLG